MSGVVHIYSHGGPEVLQFSDRTLPPPTHGEVQLTHDHIGVNYVDIMFRAGIFPMTHFPAVLGMEGAGRVIEVADKASRWNVGDRVEAEQRHQARIGLYALDLKTQKDRRTPEPRAVRDALLGQDPRCRPRSAEGRAQPSVDSHAGWRRPTLPAAP